MGSYPLCAPDTVASHKRTEGFTLLAGRNPSRATGTRRGPGGGGKTTRGRCAGASRSGGSAPRLRVGMEMEEEIEEEEKEAAAGDAARLAAAACAAAACSRAARSRSATSLSEGPWEVEGGGEGTTAAATERATRASSRTMRRSLGGGGRRGPDRFSSRPGQAKRAEGPEDTEGTDAAAERTARGDGDRKGVGEEEGEGRKAERTGKVEGEAAAAEEASKRTGPRTSST